MGPLGPAVESAVVIACDLIDSNLVAWQIVYVVFGVGTALPSVGILAFTVILAKQVVSSSGSNSSSSRSEPTTATKTHSVSTGLTETEATNV